jgi:glc operon protein GlcG
MKLIRSGARYALALLAATVLAATSAEAQLTFEQASTAMDAAEAEARANGWNLTILITDADGVPVYVRRMDGASERTWDIVQMKCHTVLTAGIPSGDYGRALAAGTMDSIPGGIHFDGGLPIRFGGEMVGAMAASGARGVEDAQVVLVGLSAIGADPQR